MIPHFLLFMGVLCLYSHSASNKLRFEHLKDARLCNNAENVHDRNVCKVRKLPNWEDGEVFHCDKRKLLPEECTAAVIEATQSSLAEVFSSSLADIDDNHNVRRIIINLNTVNSIDVKEVGHKIDDFLRPRLWWYVTKEPYAWLTHNEQHSIVLSRVQHQFEPSLRVLSALQFPDSQQVCKQSPLVLHHRDFKHPGWYSMLAQYSSVHHNLPYAITGVYVSSSNSVNDSTSFVSAEDCPDVVNKWECAFQPATSCALPTSVTRCHTKNCVVDGIANTITSSAVFDGASEDGKLIAHNSAELAAAKAATKNPPAFNEKMMRAIAAMPKSDRPTTLYGKPEHPQQAPFQSMMVSEVDHYTQGLLLRPSAFYRSRIAETIHRFQKDTGFTSSQRCVAAQIRRGDRTGRSRTLNITEFCLNPANLNSDFGCRDVPFASVTLRHVVDSAATLVEASVRSLVVTTDDEAWLDAQRIELKKTHPEWHIYSLKTPNHTHVSANQVRGPKDSDYLYMRYGAGTQSGVLLHGSIELSRQCEAFVGHFGCGGTMMVYKALCAQSNNREHVCPPSFDVRTIEELIILKGNK